MFVAIDEVKDRVVSGLEVEHTGRCEVTNKRSNPYKCVLCNSSLEYQTDRNHYLFDCFAHKNKEDCINDGNISSAHRLAQELVTKKIYNRLLVGDGLIDIDVERRIGDNTDFVISDVRVSNPASVAVEVFYKTSEIDLKRRLNTMFDQGFSVVLMFVSAGRISPERVERHLQTIAPVKVGRINLDTLEVSLGSIVSDGDLDLDKASWDRLPDYLS